MHDDHPGFPAWARALTLTCIAALALGTIVGSGGGLVEVTGCLAPGPCAGQFPSTARTPIVEPATQTIQVGGSAMFSVLASGIDNPTYLWWSGPSGGPFVAINGATADTYTLSGAQLVDDGRFFYVAVSGTYGGSPVTLTSSAARLAVSSMPGVQFGDGEFTAADWSTVAFVEPATNGPTHTEQQATTGGHPDAYRRVDLLMPPGPGTLSVFDSYQPTTYDPRTQGPIYLVDFMVDCVTLTGTLAAGPTLMLEQDGRRFVAGRSALCMRTAWTSMPFPASNRAEDFVRVDGPACVAGVVCPDFSADGQPIRFGYANTTSGAVGFPGGSGGFGIDNWKVTVWRR